MSRLRSARTPRPAGLPRRAVALIIAAAVAAPAVAVAPVTPAFAGPIVKSAAFGAPDDAAADYYAALLRHTRWVNTVWDSSINAYQFKNFNFALVLGNAVLLTHGEYDAQTAGISKEQLSQRTIDTIRYYAAKNRFVDPNGTWGKRLFWDSTFQSYFLDAGRLLWDQLDAQTRSNLTAIAVGQSTYTSDLNYGDDPLSGGWTADWPTGKYQGDTAQEEAGVYTQALAPGLAWAPDHADAARWSEQLGDWSRNAGGQLTADLNNPAVVAGKPISTNTLQTIWDTYIVENHGSFGPHYQSDIWRSGGRNAIQFILNDQPVPDYLKHQPNSAELWESIKLVMSNQGEPFMPMVNDREYLYGRDVIPMAYLGQVLRDPDAARAESNLAASLEAYQAYAPVDRLAKFSGEPKYEPEARAEIAISYLLHVESAESEAGPVIPTPQDAFFQRLSGVRDFGAGPGLAVQQSANAWAAASSKKGFLKFPWVPGHDSWLFALSGSTPFLYPNSAATVDERRTATYTAPRDGFECTSSVFRIGDGYAGQVTLPTGSALYASTGAGWQDGTVSVRNLDMGGYNGLDGSRTYFTAEGSATDTLPVVIDPHPADVNAARIDDLAFEPVQARYVRVQGQQGNAKYGYSLYSLHAYGVGEDAKTDLAAGRLASASSEDPTKPAATVTDADPNTRWAVSTAERLRADSWIRVDLGADTTVGSVRLAWEASAGERYLVQTSSDGTTWTTQAARTVSDENVARLDTVDLKPPGAEAPTPVETRFIRMQGVQGEPAYGYSLHTLRALTAAGVDAAAGKPATASSEDAGRPASAITDTDPNSRWAVSKADRQRADSWAQVDLGTPTAITQVQLGWESAAGREYRIQTSADGVTWQDAASYRYTGDQITATDGTWLNVEDKAGFVVRGGQAPITVSSERAGINAVRLGGSDKPLLVEMVSADATATAAQAAAVQPTAEGLLVSSLDGYLTAFNLTDADVTTTVTIPYSGATVSLFDGDQVLGTDSSSLTVTVPAGQASVLAPRATVSAETAAARALTYSVIDGRTVHIAPAHTADAARVEATTAAVAVDVTNAQTGETRAVPVGTPAAPTAATFPGATPFPAADLALSTLTFPASVLPAGMTTPQGAVDGDDATSWTPGPNGRMVTDLGAARAIGTVTTLWDGGDAPAATVSVSDDGITFRDIGTTDAGATHGAVSVDATARYVALTTAWSDGDPGLAALRALPPGALDDSAPGALEGELSALVIGAAAAGSVSATGFPAPTYSLVSGTLPIGLTLDPATGVFGGTPTTVGDYAFTVAADNGIGAASTRDFVGTVTATPTTPTDPGNGGGSDEGGQGGPDGDLAVTGLVLGWSLAIALLLLAGGALLVVRRHRLRLGNPE
ncbi:discoidin domain-containing protein [Agreia pratensis]|uniref:discoidin domain-containing protein n=1 Tax=Microbacteriaceae TaxID=85023 RepID=UPI00188CB388|nr:MULTISPECIES: discoidin domain-containing protein [Microbacteriaceae]MBF4561207.1 discoidin domain-containing protein [Microbacterium sp. VKM Ac-2870]MBF4633905.1 discoidin domain-containing protein [Agreia pratensis]